MQKQKFEIQYWHTTSATWRFSPACSVNNNMDSEYIIRILYTDGLISNRLPGLELNFALKIYLPVVKD